MKYLIFLLLMMDVAQAQTYNPPDIDESVGNPSIVVNSAAGSGALASITGSNISGVIVVTTGSGTLSNAVLATITFGGTDTHTACLLTPANTNAVGQTTMVYANQPVSSVWSIGVGGAPVQANVTYIWGYQCT